MRIPTSSIQKAPYIFRTGFGVELHNFDPVNTAKGVYFDMELGRGFTTGFSAVQGGDTTSLNLISKSQYTPQVEFGFHFQQRVYMYNDLSLSVGLQDVVFESSSDKEGILNLNTELLSFFVVLGSEKDLGGTMRLGLYDAVIKNNSLISKIYSEKRIKERHRHRYEVNIKYKKDFEKKGLIFSALSPDGTLPEIIELNNHPWFVGVQFHPEFKSRPFTPHPLFSSFIKAANLRRRIN